MPAKRTKDDSPNEDELREWALALRKALTLREFRDVLLPLYRRQSRSRALTPSERSAFRAEAKALEACLSRRGSK